MNSKIILVKYISLYNFYYKIKLFIYLFRLRISKKDKKNDKIEFLKI